MINTRWPLSSVPCSPWGELRTSPGGYFPAVGTWGLAENGRARSSVCRVMKGPFPSGKGSTCNSFSFPFSSLSFLCAVGELPWSIEQERPICWRGAGRRDTAQRKLGGGEKPVRFSQNLRRNKAVASLFFGPILT